MHRICGKDYSHLATPLLLSRSCSAPTLLLPRSSFCPAPLLLCSFQAPIRHIPSSSPFPAQLLPSSYPLFALLCFTVLSSAPVRFPPCSYPAHASAPLLLCSSPAPALLLVLPTPVWQPSSSSSAPYDFFRNGESRLLRYTLFIRLISYDFVPERVTS